MDRAERLRAVQKAYAETAVDFEGVTDEQEAKVMDAIATALGETKP
jgi:hypothetical protein